MEPNEAQPVMDTLPDAPAPAKQSVRSFKYVIPSESVGRDEADSSLQEKIR
jgi:hypothetical protein